MKSIGTPFLLLTVFFSCLALSGCGSDSGGSVAPTTTTWYADQDQDGFGNTSVSKETEEQPDGYVSNAFDCDDTLAAVNPGQKEIVDDLDNDCDGLIDESPEPGIIPDTGQTTSYTDTFGEDSDYLIDPPSYTKLDETGQELSDDVVSWAMVRDNVTGLIWEAKNASDGMENKSNPHDPDNTYTFEEANGSFIDNLNAEDFGQFGDGGTWRLPTITELALICSSDTFKPAFNKDYFLIFSTFVGVWSSTANGQTESNVWVMKPLFGNIVSQARDSTFRAMAVRGNAVKPTLKTYGGGIARDTATSLMWIQEPATGDDGEGYTFEEAIEYCENLTYGGFTDWRLPSKNELFTLLRFEQSEVALDTEHLSEAADLPFWTSTTFISELSSDYAWYVKFDEVRVFYQEDTEMGWIRPVRGGNNAVMITWYRDSDEDGYGDEAVFTILDSTVSQPDGYVADNTDCDDGDPDISPVSEDLVNDGIDQDCSGLDNQTWYRDEDGDSYGDLDVFEYAETQPEGYIRNQDHIDNQFFDCNDGNAAIHPGAVEITDDGLDNDCNGKQQVSWYADDDGDGYGRGSRVSVGEDLPDTGSYAKNDLDCNDADGAVHPGLAETLGDAADTNCNGDPDDGTLAHIPDTGQTTSYSDTWGEDADYLIQAPSYSRLDAAGQVTEDTSTPWLAVKDNITGLVWEVKTVDNADVPYTYDGANLYVSTLNLCGYDDWRLPTLTELATLAHMDSDNPAIDTEYFPNTQANRYWTSSQDGSDSQVLTVWFRYGESSRQNTTATLRVRAVRGKIALPSELTVNGDGTVTDLASGLMWSDVALSNDTWENSVTFWENANHAGYEDWRLPTLQDVNALAELKERNSALLLSDYFTLTTSGYFWMLIYDESLDDYAKVFSMIQGNTETRSTASDFNGRGVRGTRLGRFIDNGDGTVFDRYTGLMWTKERVNDSTFITFGGALASADSLETGGYTDWRLPSRNELISLLDARMDDIETFDDVFTDPEGLYWSSTSSSALSGYAWQIRFTDGSIDISLGLKTTENTFRAVRGGM